MQAAGRARVLSRCCARALLMLCPTCLGAASTRAHCVRCHTGHHAGCSSRRCAAGAGSRSSRVVRRCGAHQHPRRRGRQAGAAAAVLHIARERGRRRSPFALLQQVAADACLVGVQPHVAPHRALARVRVGAVGDVVVKGLRRAMAAGQGVGVGVRGRARLPGHRGCCQRCSTMRGGPAITLVMLRPTLVQRATLSLYLRERQWRQQQMRW